MSRFILVSNTLEFNRFVYIYMVKNLEILENNLLYNRDTTICHIEKAKKKCMRIKKLNKNVR